MAVVVKNGNKAPTLRERAEVREEVGKDDASLKGVTQPERIHEPSKDSIQQLPTGIIIEMGETAKDTRVLPREFELLVSLRETHDKLIAAGTHIISAEEIGAYYDHASTDVSLIGYDLSAISLRDVREGGERSLPGMRQWEDKRRTYLLHIQNNNDTREVFSSAVNEDSVEYMREPDEVAGYKMAFTSANLSQRFEILISPKDRLDVLGTGNESLHELAVEYAQQGHTPTAVKELIIELCKEREIRYALGHRSF